MLLVHEVISAEEALVRPIVTSGPVLNGNSGEVFQLSLLDKIVFASLIDVQARRSSIW
jgi:hypothetical protein